VFGAGSLLALLTGALVSDSLRQLILLSLGSGTLFFTLVCAHWLTVSESRTRRVRRLLGRHRRGSSDPATWTMEDCETVPEPAELFACSSFELAVESLLEKEDYSGAMWAARLCVIKESRLRGEELTSRILQHPAVKGCLAKAEENPKAWLDSLAEHHTRRPQ
jgi:hypothetical protein